MLEIKNIKKSFDENHVIKGLTFDVKPGEIQAILGKNGAGKTTLFRMILQILKPDQGEILLNGQKITFKDASKFGFLPEERSLLKKMTINQQLNYFAELKEMKVKDIEPRIDMWLERFNLSEYKHRKMKELSKGNQQKIQLISALIHEPEVVILDEPFSGLDPFNIELFRDAIIETAKRGAHVVFSSHRLDYIESFSEEIIVLVEGEDKINGKIDDIKKDMNKFNVTINGEFDNSLFSNIEHIENIIETVNGVIVEISDYSAVKDIFNAIRNSNIEQFKVDLPTLEQIIKENIREDYNA